MEDFLVSVVIFQRDLLESDCRAASLRDQFQSVGEDGKRGQPEKVHLQQAQLVDRHHVEGGYDFIVLSAMQRNQIGERPWRDHDPSRVHAGIAHHAFQFLRGLEQFPNLPIFFDGLAQLGGILDGLLQRNVELRRHHLGNAIHVGVRDVHGPANVFDCGLRGHGAEGDDLGHVVAPIFLCDVLNDLAPPVHAKINIDIRHGHALRVQKALEQQLMLQRVDIGDSQCIRDQRSRGRSAARSNRNVVLAGIADEIPDDQKISRKLHLLDDGEFALQALLVIGNGVLQLALLVQRPQSLQPPRKALAGDVYEVAVDGIARRNFKLRKRIRYFLQAHAATLGNIEGSREHLRRILEHARHFIVTLHEELVAFEFHAAGVVNRFAGLDAEHDVLGVGVVFAEVMAVVGGDQPQAEIFFELEEAGMDAMLHLQALVLNLKIEILFTENVGERSGGRARGVVIVLHQAFRDFAFQASR